ncbi:prospero homeobox protein 2 [Chanos chanos]|uniref:Prospero homeobox protein 2 n=1 Tax=Chanos chanos TaxID=29144 RepID=A0A6J2WKR0_CHACN|nr:prospero homeobox protein 2 [Chanos chanos]
MNLSLPDQNMHNPNEGSLEDNKADLLLPCFHRGMYEEPLSTYPNGSIISHLLRKTIHSKRNTLNSSLLYFPATAMTGSNMVDTGVNMADSTQEDQSSISSKDSLGESISPGGLPSNGLTSEVEKPLNDHLQAKRARVENIIRGMAGSPNARLHGEGEKSEGEASTGGREVCKENKRKQRLPQHQDHSEPMGSASSRSSSGSTKEEECHKLKEQLQSMQRLLRQLQERFLQVYNQTGSGSGEKERENTKLDDRESCETLGFHLDSHFNKKLGNVQANYKDKAVSDYVTHQNDSHSLRETLKCELSRAINESVDTVFRKLSMSFPCQSPEPRQCQSPEHSGVAKRNQLSAAPDLSDSEDAVKTQSQELYETGTNRSPEHQTEALSLVIRKPPLAQLSSVSQTVKRPYPIHQSPFQFTYGTPLHDTQILEHLLKYGPHANFAGLHCPPPSLDRSSPDSMDLSWDSITMRSKVTSGHLSQHTRTAGLGQVSVDTLCLPQVKMECGDLQSMAERSTFMSLNIQEGLTPNHLKKAKLMFFYTRYPSSNVLKTFFPDVKFNRCITSQLIKWFSNFREFYYIQMEKFARQAIVDGVNDVKDLSVTRDSELFRALNMHYNKANDFQVPDRFLEVSEITLHEFFNAISLAKDSDPSWKKAIYKVICKLDGDVPEEFKSPSYL